jgi:D-glycero-alpha-D-manno-heptose-7-phosphate kinase
MIIRSKAPLRLGLAGGGTDVSPYCDLYGGFVLNATIDLYAYCSITLTDNDTIEIIAADLKENIIYPLLSELPINGKLDLVKGVYNRVIKDFKLPKNQAFRIVTYSDAPPGSGLGSSSTMVVAILKAFTEWFNLPLGEYDIAQLAYDIERKDLNLSGGKQDQYAATFGGFNFIEFLNDKIIVNPLRVKRWVTDELEASMLLFYTGTSRSSARIIKDQQNNTISGNKEAIQAMHDIKKSAVYMKEALLKGDINFFAEILGKAWEDKKKMASSISNDSINTIYDTAINAGAMAGKVSGAGGGGFMMFVVDPEKKIAVTEALMKFDGKIVGFHFSDGGCHGWKIYN